MACRYKQMKQEEEKDYSNSDAVHLLIFLCISVPRVFAVSVQTIITNLSSPPLLLLVLVGGCPTLIDVFFQCGKVRLLVHIVRNVVFL
jgi:hypothetical protein